MSFVGDSYERLFDLRIVKIWRGVAFFDSEARAPKKRLVGPMSPISSKPASSYRIKTSHFYV